MLELWEPTWEKTGRACGPRPRGKPPPSGATAGGGALWGSACGTSWGAHFSGGGGGAGGRLGSRSAFASEGFAVFASGLQGSPPGVGHVCLLPPSFPAPHARRCRQGRPPRDPAPAHVRPPAPLRLWPLAEA